jgi:hypothetical protein
MGLKTRVVWGCAVLLAVPGPIAAQGTFDAVGTRALGAGSAFVAVADDATAVHWNPAGLAGGEMASLTIGVHDFQVGKSSAPVAPTAVGGRTSLTSLGTWPLGVSYGTLDLRRVHALPGNALEARRLHTRHAGATVLQSVADWLVVGTTVRVIRAESSSVSVAGGRLRAAFDALDTVPADSAWLLDLDVGLLATAGRLRGGLALRNLRSLSIGATSRSWAAMPRQARAGLSVQVADGVTLATDLELNTVDLLGDLRRMSALGAEVSLGPRLLVRSGVRWNLAMSSGPAGALGASFRVRQALWLDAHYARGGDEARQVSIALRASP